MSAPEHCSRACSGALEQCSGAVLQYNFESLFEVLIQIKFYVL
jgi:hypothetical protein